mgnify:CR=1 FL=1
MLAGPRGHHASTNHFFNKGGNGPSASTIGANRAGGAALEALRWSGKPAGSRKPGWTQRSSVLDQYARRAAALAAALPVTAVSPSEHA